MAWWENDRGAVTGADLLRRVRAEAYAEIENAFTTSAQACRDLGAPGVARILSTHAQKWRARLDRETGEVKEVP